MQQNQANIDRKHTTTSTASAACARASSSDTAASGSTTGRTASTTAEPATSNDWLNGFDQNLGVWLGTLLWRDQDGFIHVLGLAKLARSQNESTMLCSMS
jgi:hypothetical protein